MFRISVSVSFMRKTTIKNSHCNLTKKGPKMIVANPRQTPAKPCPTIIVIPAIKHHTTPTQNRIMTVGTAIIVRKVRKSFHEKSPGGGPPR